MPDDSAPILGWKSMLFLYGAEEAMIAESERVEGKCADPICSRESCGSGCYLSMCDFDQLDQQ